jgi:hypothetical protein
VVLVGALLAVAPPPPPQAETKTMHISANNGHILFMNWPRFTLVFG